LKLTDIIASDQQSNQFYLFPREGTPANPNDQVLHYSE
jgi:hypothetical protein